LTLIEAINGIIQPAKRRARGFRLLLPTNHRLLGRWIFPHHATLLAARPTGLLATGRTLKDYELQGKRFYHVAEREADQDCLWPILATLAEHLTFARRALNTLNGRLRRLVRAEVLYWDDLGQTHLTGAASEMLLHLVEERTCAGMPILATTQYFGEGMDAQFERKEMGQAIRRRLNEFVRSLWYLGEQATGPEPASCR
jgi:hypothetical protein